MMGGMGGMMGGMGGMGGMMGSMGNSATFAGVNIAGGGMMGGMGGYGGMGGMGGVAGRGDVAGEAGYCGRAGAGPAPEVGAVAPGAVGESGGGSRGGHGTPLAVLDRALPPLRVAEPGRVVSPTDFHNSVHNAAAGYWSIAVGARRNSTSIGAHDTTVAAGLLEAAALLLDEDALLLVMYDVPQPKPLLDQHPITTPVSIALVLTRTRSSRSCAQLRLAFDDRATSSTETFDDEALEALRKSNPAARALPLLRALAQPSDASLCIDAVAGRRLRIDVTRCT